MFFWALLVLLFFVFIGFIGFVGLKLSNIVFVVLFGSMDHGAYVQHILFVLLHQTKNGWGS